MQTMLIVLFFSGAQVVFAQEDEEPPKEEKPASNVPEVIPDFKPSIRGSFKLPQAMANRTFKKLFNGVSNLEVNYTQPFAKNFFVAALFQHGYYDINKFAFNEVSYGKMQSFMAIGEVGYQKYMNPRWYYTLSVRAGYGMVMVHTPNCPVDPRKNMLFTEEQVGFYLRGNERMSYGILISHQIYHFAFGPEWVCRETFGGMTADDYKGLSHSVTIGFGFTCYLGKEFREP